MPTYTLTAPNGKTYDIEGPPGATEAQVRAEVLRRDPSAGQAPQSPAAAPAKTSQPVKGKPEQDIVGRIKNFMTDPNEAGRLWPGGPRIGPQIFKPVGDAARNLGKFLLPGSVPEAAAQVPAMLIPGGGVARALARPAASAVARGGAGAAMGKSPLEEGAKGLVQGVVGETLGGAGRAATRAVAPKVEKLFRMDDPTKLAKVAKKFIPGLGGTSAEDTITKVTSGEAQAQLSTNYTQALTGLFKQHGDPVVVLPSLERAGGKKATEQASRALAEIQDMERSLRTQLGDISRRANALEKLDALDAARKELQASLAKQWGKDGAAGLSKIGADYGAGKVFLKLFTGGRDTMTETRLKALRKGGQGELDWPTLQQTFERQAGRLRKKPNAKELEEALFRGEKNIGKRDIPGGVRHVGVGVPGFHAYAPIPHAPVRVGQPEITAEQVARAARMLGVRSLDDLLSQ